MSTSKRSRRQSPGIDEGASSADRNVQHSPRPSRNGHDMRREDSVSRSRFDTDDRWRTADTPERYAYDRRDEQRRGESNEAREGEGWSRHGHNDLISDRTPLDGRLDTGTTTALAAMADQRVVLVTMAGILVMKMTGGRIVGKGRRGNGNETTAGNLASLLQRRMLGTSRLVSGLPGTARPLIARIALGNQQPRGSQVAETMVPIPTNGIRITIPISRRTRVKGVRKTRTTTATATGKSATGETMTAS
ncbi:hypothetical protein C8Q70DRAFT_757247 [Cubamyces menziesii]|nr:hypothetical protein C8Q70DRAFT_757247 [Cubamyces menziesii]